MTASIIEAVATTSVVAGLATAVVAAVFPELDQALLVGVFVAFASVILVFRWRASGLRPLPPSAVVSLQSLAGAAVVTFLFWYFITDSAVWWIYGIFFLVTFGAVHSRLLAAEAHRRTIDGGE